MWKKTLYNVIMPSEDTKILEFNQYQKSDKATLIIYADKKKYLLCKLKKCLQCLHLEV